MKKKMQAKWLHTTFVFWQWFIINIFLWSSADVRIDMSSWFAIDQMYFSAFNLNFHKISWVDYRREDKMISYNLITSMPGVEYFSKSYWLTNENQKTNPSSPQIPGYIGQNHQITWLNFLFFFFHFSMNCLLDHLGIFHIIRDCNYKYLRNRCHLNYI